MQRARDRLGGNGQRTILFLDEIHRSQQAQQDALLPAVEEGLLTLIGATTENPYFEVNSALSRCQVVELEALSGRARRGRPARGGRDRRAVRRARRADRAAGRRRRPYRAEHDRARLGDRAGRERAARGAPRRRRRSQAAAPLRQGRRPALRLRLRLHQVDARLRSARPSTTWPRCSRAARIRASSRAGWSSSPPRTSATPIPRALQVAVAAAHALEHVGLPEAQLNLAQAAIYLANAPKSKASANAIWSARATCARAATCGRRRCSATPTTPARRSSATAAATSTRTPIRAASRSTSCPRS